jgi:hypothetical protein
MCIERNSIVFTITCKRTCHEGSTTSKSYCRWRKILNNEDNTTSEDERSNQVAENRTLLDFHESGAKNEVKESSQEVEARIKVYQR